MAGAPDSAASRATLPATEALPIAKTTEYGTEGYIQSFFIVCLILEVLHIRSSFGKSIKLKAAPAYLLNVGLKRAMLFQHDGIKPGGRAFPFPETTPVIRPVAFAEVVVRPPGTGNPIDEVSVKA